MPTDLVGLTNSVAASTGGMAGRLKLPSQEDDASIPNVSNDDPQKKGRRRDRREKERRRPAASEPPAHNSTEIAAELSTTTCQVQSLPGLDHGVAAIPPWRVYLLAHITICPPS